VKLNALQGKLVVTAFLAVCTVAVAQPPQPIPAPPPAGAPVFSPGAQRVLRGGSFAMNYENLDIRVLARIVSELTGRTLLLDEGVQGRVTLLASAQMRPDELWQVFEGVLQRNGFGLRQASSGVFQVVPIAEARRDVRGATAAVVLREGDATQLLAAIRPLLSDPNAAQVYGPGKSLVITDTPAVVQQIIRLVQTMDRATPQVRIETIFLQYAEAERLAPLLQQVITRTQPLPGQHVPVITAFPPTNALLVQATPETLAEIRRAVAQLDVAKAAPLSVEKPRYFVYKLKHGRAEDVAKVMQDLLSERKRALDEEERRRGRQAATTGMFAQLQPPTVVNGTVVNPTPTPATTNTTGNATGEGAQQVAYVGARVGADPEINAVLVYVSPSEYPSIRTVLDSLDRQRKQVLVHVMVAEVTLSDLLEAGGRLQLFNESGVAASFNGGATQEGLLSFLSSGQFLLGAAGPSNRTINVGGRDVSVPGFFGFISANQQNRDFDLLSAPRLVATDHKKAELKVGNVVPFATGARFSQIGQPVVTYDYKDVGIRLEFTPHISQSKIIRIELEQEVQEVTEFLEQNLGGFGYVIPLISNRRVKTDVNLREGETLLIGGLISKRTTETIRKVPLLGDIPLIQNLFRELRKENRKTSLFVALTPYLVNNSDDIARIDEAYRQFMDSEGLPSQGQWEPRDTKVGRQAVRDPYLPNAQDPQPSLVLEQVRLAAPTTQDRLRQPRITVRNQDRQVEAEVELRMRVTRPDREVEEVVGGRLRLAPGESREVLLSPYPFPAQAGTYRFDVEAFVGNRRVGQTAGSAEVLAP
jgi:general secretion pathway protein D